MNPAITLARVLGITLNVTTANQEVDLETVLTAPGVVFEGFLIDNRNTADVFLHFDTAAGYTYNADDCVRVKTGEQIAVLLPKGCRYINCRSSAAGKVILHPIRK